MSFSEKVVHLAHGTEVLASWFGEGGHAVPPSTSQARADICLNHCPHNRPNSNLTKAIALAFRRYLEVKNTIGLRVRGEKRLFECDICACQLRLKVHEPTSLLKRRMQEGERERFPDYCWQRNETK